MPTTDQREHEAKFQIELEQHALLLAQNVTLKGYAFQPTTIRAQTDIYMDTPAYDLLRYGLALRVRHDVNGAEVGIKGISAEQNGAIQARLDVAFALPADATPLDASTWPRTVEAQLATTSAKLKELCPLLVIRQTRHKSNLHPDNSGPPQADANMAARTEWNAEWSADRVWIDTEFDNNQSVSARDEDNRPHFYELEIEFIAPKAANGAEPASEADTQEDAGLAARNEAAFAALVDHVQTEFALTPIYTSKYVRGLERIIAQAHDNADALTATMTLAEGGRLLLHQQLLQIMLNEHGVRAGKDADYVHEMRVAIRRARAAMHLCQSAISADELAPHLKRLKRLGRVLGEVRDLDVALANLRTFARTQPESQRSGIKRLRGELKKRHRHARSKLMALLNSQKHRKFIKEFAHFCTTPNQASSQQASRAHEIIPTQVRHTIPSIILAAFSAVRAYEVAFTGPQLPPLETFHALRIQTKYLRYLVEFTRHLMGDEGTTLAAQLRALQEHLGELNDAHVDAERLRRWERELADEHELVAAIESRRTLLTARMQELTTSVPLDSFVSPHNRAILAQAIAHI